MTHSFDVRVYYEDTDAAGIVYYANYLKFAERARTEILRGLGIDQRPLMHEYGIGFVVRRVGVEYFVPARLDDLLTIKTLARDITKATLVMQQVIMRGDERLVELEVKLAVVQQETGKIGRMPDHVFQAMKTL